MGQSLQRRLLGDESFRVVPIARGEPIPNGASARDILVHAAWPPSEHEAWPLFRDWSLELHSVAAERGTRFIAFGSGVELHASGLKEPYRSYVERKLELKQTLRDSDNLTWLRLHFMFGPGEQPSRLVPDAVRAGLAGETFVCGSLDRRRRWLHVDDQATYLAEFFKAPQPGEWDIAGRHDVSFRDLLRLVGCAIGRDLQVTESDVVAPDAAVPIVAPERVAPVVPVHAGDRSSLLRRLKEYSAQLSGASTGT